MIGYFCMLVVLKALSLVEFLNKCGMCLCLHNTQITGIFLSFQFCFVICQIYSQSKAIDQLLPVLPWCIGPLHEWGPRQPTCQQQAHPCCGERTHQAWRFTLHR